MKKYSLPQHAGKMFWTSLACCMLASQNVPSRESNLFCHFRKSTCPTELLCSYFLSYTWVVFCPITHKHTLHLKVVKGAKSDW